MSNACFIPFWTDFVSENVYPISISVVNDTIRQRIGTLRNQGGRKRIRTSRLNSQDERIEKEYEDNLQRMSGGKGGSIKSGHAASTSTSSKQIIDKKDALKNNQKAFQKVVKESNDVTMDRGFKINPGIYRSKFQSSSKEREEDSNGKSTAEKFNNILCTFIKML